MQHESRRPVSSRSGLFRRLHRRLALGALACLAVPACICFAPASHAQERDIRLVLQITVDGLRGDLLNRYRRSFGNSGFNYLLQNGAVFTNAHYLHANTETIVGHTTLSTGAHPSQHGMVGNVIFDRDAGEIAYNIEDADSPLLPTRDEKKEGEQVDPAQKKSRTQGRSPKKILVSTLADELFMHYAGRSKIFGVSGKDRSAIAMAGHAGKAFWFSTSTGDYVTSAYYYKAYPEWAAAWNEKRHADSHAGTSWELTADRSTYMLRNQDDRTFETDLGGYGKTFPHPFGTSDDKLFYTRILVSPAGDRLSADFAKQIVKHEDLGQDEVPDYLSVSFSGVDAVNHFFGPSSLENEAVVRDLDRTLADFFAFIDTSIGLKHTLIVFSADHGMPEAPEVMAERGMDVRRLDPDDVAKAAAKAGLEKFGTGGLVHSFFRPYLYLNSKAIRAAGLDRAQVETVMATAIRKLPGIAAAVPTTALPKLQDTPLIDPIRRNTHPDRSGDIYVIQQPYWFLQEGGAIAVMHGTPWTYDTFVPIIFAGPGISPKQVARPVHPVNVAPTLAALLGIKPPAAAMSGALPEALR